MKNIFIMAALFIVISACNKGTESKYANGGGGNSNQKATELMYPHDKEWVNNHGAKFLQDKQQCFSCHGADGSGGNSQVSCTKCHGGFPHASNFALPQNHGKAFDGGRDACLHCHENPDKKADKKVNPVSCKACHKAYPHEEGFAEGGHSEIAKTYEGKCTSCHKDMKSHMPNYAETGGCITCHDGNTTPPVVKWPKDCQAPKPSAKIKVRASDRLPSSQKQKK